MVSTASYAELEAPWPHAACMRMLVRVSLVSYSIVLCCVLERSLHRRPPVIIKEFDTPKARLYRHGDSLGSRVYGLGSWV